MYIKSVHIKNIRSIQELTIDFSKNSPDLAGWHVLIGENGSGKTTILRCMALGLLGNGDINSLRIVADSYSKISSDSDEILMTISKDRAFDRFIGASNLAKRGENVDEDAMRAFFEKNEALDVEVGIIENTPTHLLQFVTWLERGSGTSKEYLASSYYSAEIEGFLAVGLGTFRRFSGGKEAWDDVYKTNPRAAALMSLFGEDVALTQIEPWLKTIYLEEFDSGKENFRLRSIKTLINDQGLLPEGIKLEKIDHNGIYFKDANGADISLHQLSDGYRSLLALVMELIRQLLRVYKENLVFGPILAGGKSIDLPGIVLIDEIDAHLHPSWQTEIGIHLMRLFPKIQFIVTTHSPLICRAAERGSIWKLPALGTGQVEEVTGIDKDRLVFGNVLDAYGTELFGSEPVKFKKNDEKRSRLGKLKMRSALGVITEEERAEKLKLEMTLATDDTPAI
jgi:predicted ATPase